MKKNCQAKTIAMGGLGSDATIEAADIVIQNDQPLKIVAAIIIVLLLGAGGIATLWEAVIADVGVTLLAILNAVPIQGIKI